MDPYTRGKSCASLLWALSWPGGRAALMGVCAAAAAWVTIGCPETLHAAQPAPPAPQTQPAAVALPTPPPADCQAPTLNSDKLYSAALAIAQSGPKELSKAYVEKLLGVRLPQAIEENSERPGRDKFLYRCAQDRGKFEIILSIYDNKKYKIAGVTNNKEDNLGSALDFSWGVDYILCKSRDSVLNDALNHKWKNLGNTLPPIPEVPRVYDIYSSSAVANGYKLYFHFTRELCLNRVQITSSN